MISRENIHSSILELLKMNLGHKFSEYQIPPPVFVTMEGMFLEFDQELKSIKTRFPVLEKYTNPYGFLQGGIITALIDNTIGPLSILIAPPNLTRSLEIKFSSPITLGTKYITVFAKFIDRSGSKIRFNAVVRDPNDKKIASAKATHWIIKNDELQGNEHQKPC